MAIVICCFAIIIFPNVDQIIDPWFVAPDFVVELVVALWLTIKGVKIAALASRNALAHT